MSQHLNQPNLIADAPGLAGTLLSARVEDRPGQRSGAPSPFKGLALPRPTFEEIGYVFCASDQSTAVAALRRFGAKNLGYFYPATPSTLSDVLADKLGHHLTSGLPVVVVACPGDAQ